MHPRLRAFGRAELDVTTAVFRLLAARQLMTSQAGLTYARGTFGLALALALTPAIASEGVIMHVLLGGSVVAWTCDGLHAYMLILAVGICVGSTLLPAPRWPADSRIARGPALAGAGTTLGGSSAQSCAVSA